MKVIYLHGNIGADWWSDGITSKGFAREFDAALASGEEIEIRINSPGGSVFEGIAIYNKIAANRSKVTTVVDGIAYSMAAVIAMAADTRKAMKNATIMIHNVSGGAYGNANDLRGALEMMDKLDDSLVESIAQFTGSSAEDIKATYFDYRDHTLSAKEALEAKFLTDIIDLNAENVPANVAAMSKEQLFAHYAKLNGSADQRGVFNKLLDEMRAFVAPKTPVVTEPTTPTNQDMKMIINKSSAAIVAALAISFAENETEKEVELNASHLTALNSALVAAAEKSSTAENSLTTITAERDALQVKVNALPGAAPSSPIASAKKEGEINHAESVSILAPEAQSEINNNY